MKNRLYCIFVSALVLPTCVGFSDTIPAKIVADMEGETKYHVTNDGKVTITDKNPAQGKRCLRFETDTQSTLGFSVDGADGFNAVAFDIYCERDNGATLGLDCWQKKEGKTKEGYTKTVRWQKHFGLHDFKEGWNSVVVIKDIGLRWVGSANPDWGKMRSVRFQFGGTMEGTCVCYLDNIRFERREVKKTANMLYNSSFEIATNPDVPDGWRRDFNAPPYSEAVWGIDTATTQDGAKSLRIGVAGKYAEARQEPRVTEGQHYTLSAYLKSRSGSAKAHIGIRGTKHKAVTVTNEWKRYSTTVRPSGGRAGPYIHFYSADEENDALWIDALQFEPGTNATPYAPSVVDDAKAAEVVPKSRQLSESGRAVACPHTRIRRAATAPVIDGNLGDQCWKEAVETTPFLKLTANEPAARKTVARLSYDDKALYVAVRADEPDMKAVDDLLESAGSPWATDAIELFIDFNRDRKTYYHFAANAKGLQYSARHTTTEVFAGAHDSWNCEWSAAGSTDGNGWTVEMAVPYSCFDLRPEVKVGNVIGVNVCRQDPRNKVYSSWAFSDGGFHTPQAFGEVRGFEPDLSPYRFEVLGLDHYRGIARATIRNNTGKDQQVKVSLVDKDPDGETHSADSEHVIGAGGTTEAALPLPLRSDGTHKVFVEVRDRNGHLRLVGQSLEVRVAGADILNLVGTEFDFYTRESEAPVRCFVGIDKDRCKGLELAWWLEQESTAVTGRSALIPEPGINQWNVPIRDLPNGSYVLKVVINGKGAEIAATSSPFRKLPPAEHEVRINQWGRFLVCDGEPLLWYGFYSNVRVKPEQQTWWSGSLDEMRGANCNTVLAYVHMSCFFRDNEDKLAKAIGAAHARGLKIWVHLSWMLGAYRSPTYAEHPFFQPYRFASEDDAKAKIVEVVNKYKNHPALLGWCTVDEPTAGGRSKVYTKEYMKEYYRLIKETDPYHPCIYSHFIRPGAVGLYAETTDMALVNYFPNPKKDEVFKAFWETGLPLVANVPCYRSDIDMRRGPTPAEQRSQIYKALILGARGICSYTFRCNSVHTWREYQRIGKELQTLGPILLTPDDQLRVEVSPRGKKVFALLKSCKGKHYLLAVNTAMYPIEASFRLVDLSRVGKVTPMFGTRETQVDSEAKTIDVNMEPQSTAVYEIQ